MRDDPLTGIPRVSDSVIINNLILQNGIAAAKMRALEVDAFINATVSTNTVVMEVLKGALASKSV